MHPVMVTIILLFTVYGTVCAWVMMVKGEMGFALS